MMTPTIDMPAGLRKAMLAGMDAALRAGGAVMPPTMHLLAEDMDQPYVGYLTCRRFRRGGDAEQAITEMGMLPSALAATRVLLGWEQTDMHAAFGLPGQVPLAVVVLEATLGGDHWLWRYPFDLDAGRRAAADGPVLLPRWGQPERVDYLQARLPDCMARLLDVWRALREMDLEGTMTRLEAAGHRMHWASR